MVEADDSGSVNIAFPYAAQDEMTTAIREAARVSAESGKAVDPAAITQHLSTAECPPVDLVVRTSGVRRFSDFLLWQTVGGAPDGTVNGATVHFSKTLWPNFGLLDMLPMIIGWQADALTDRAMAYLPHHV